jgi:ABC-2 type transport system permease protein
MTATTGTLREVVGARTPGFTSIMASEWIKIWSVRAMWVITFLAVTLSIGIAALMSVVEGHTVDTGAEGQLAFDPLNSIFIGTLFGTILLIVFSVLAVTSEYQSRTIRTSVTATPNRSRLLAGKLATVAGIGIALSLIMLLGMFFVTQIIHGAYGLPTAGLGDDGIARFLFISILFGGLIYTVIPLSMGFLLRGTASAVTLSIGFFLMPTLLSALLPIWVQENVLVYMPDKAMFSLSGRTDPEAAFYISQGPALLAIIVWLIGLAVIAGVVFKRRDA